MTTTGVETLGTGTTAGDFARATPSCTVTSPVGTVSATPFNVTWTYSSPVSRSQTAYRVRILSQSGATVIYDSAIVAGSGTTASTSVILSSGSSYLAAVSVYDGFDWSAEDTESFVYDGNDLNDITPLASVGTVYEVAINGVGYMLMDHPDKPERRYSARVIPLDAPRQATSDTPFSEAIERYTLVGGTEWVDGAGQRFYKRLHSSDRAYLTSNGVDPFTHGELRLLPSTTLLHDDNYAFSKAVVAHDKLYITSAAGALTGYDDPDDESPTEFTITGAGTVLDLASDGTFWYYADGANVYRNDEAADASAWSTLNVEKLEWCTDRMVAAYKDGTSSTTNAIATLNYSTGAANGPNAGAAYVLEEETDIRSITSGDGFMWWAAARYDKSVVYGQRLGSEDSYIIALELPAGQDVRSIGYYLGNVFVRCREITDGSTAKAIIYRCVASDGRLTPELVTELEDDGVDHKDGDFAGDDRFVYFSWRAMNEYSGIGCVDLSTGGYAKWLEAPANTGFVRSIVQWYGRTVFTIDGYGAVIEAAPGEVDDNTVASGSLTTSIIDLNTGQRKGFEGVTVTFDPLPSGATITVEYSLDAGTSFTALSPIVSAAGQKIATWDLDAESDSIMLRVTLTHETTTTPVLRSLLVKAHSMGLADLVLVLPINCFDRVTGLNGREIADQSGPGKGSARRRRLENLAQTRVLVQDVDWQDTQTTHIFDVVAVETDRIGVMGPKQRQSNGYITTVTMRSSLR